MIKTLIFECAFSICKNIRNNPNGKSRLKEMFHCDILFRLFKNEYRLKEDTYHVKKMPHHRKRTHVRKLCLPFHETYQKTLERQSPDHHHRRQRKEAESQDLGSRSPHSEKECKDIRPGRLSTFTYLFDNRSNERSRQGISFLMSGHGNIIYPLIKTETRECRNERERQQRIDVMRHAGGDIRQTLGESRLFFRGLHAFGISSKEEIPLPLFSKASPKKTFMTRSKRNTERLHTEKRSIRKPNSTGWDTSTGTGASYVRESRKVYAIMLRKI